MWTTPERLHTILEATVAAYEAMRKQAQAKLGASEQSVTPWKVKIMKELRDELIRKYL